MLLSRNLLKFNVRQKFTRHSLMQSYHQSSLATLFRTLKFLLAYTHLQLKHKANWEFLIGMSWLLDQLSLHQCLKLQVKSFF